MTVPDLDCLLLWYGVWNKAEKLSKSEKVGRLIIALSSKGDPPAVEEWTADDEARLLSLQENKITIDDTALGRKRVLFEQQMVAASITMSDEQWEHSIQMRKQQRKVVEEVEVVEHGDGVHLEEVDEAAMAGGLVVFEGTHFSIT